MLVLLCALATIALHRLWHHEAVFASARTAVVIPERVSPLVFVPIAAALTLCPPVLLLIALYAPLRAAVWAYEKYDPPPAAAGCGCGQGVHIPMVNLQTQLRAKDKRVIAVGFPSMYLRSLSAQHPNWLIVDMGAAPTVAAENILYWTPGKDLLADLFKIILNGGNATIVTFNKFSEPAWLDAVGKIGNMKAVAWVHVLILPKAGIQVPKHHRVVVALHMTGEAVLHKAIETAEYQA